MAQAVKNLPAIWKTWVQSLGREDPLGKGMAAHSSIQVAMPHGFELSCQRNKIDFSKTGAGGYQHKNGK